MKKWTSGIRSEQIMIRYLDANAKLTARPLAAGRMHDNTNSVAFPFPRSSCPSRALSGPAHQATLCLLCRQSEHILIALPRPARASSVNPSTYMRAAGSLASARQAGQRISNVPSVRKLSAQDGASAPCSTRQHRRGSWLAACGHRSWIDRARVHGAASHPSA